MLERAKGAWRGRLFTSVKRSDIVALLDKVASERGPTAGDFLLARLSSLTKWFASRHDDYQSPLYGVSLRRTSTQDRARDRILSDSEVRAVWLAAEQGGVFGAFVRICLLTGQRRTKVATMRWDDIDGNVWTVRRMKRQKGVGGSLRLPAVAIEIINAQPHYISSPFIFASSRTSGPINGYSDLKKKFDPRCLIAHWTPHDLRRTAETLMVDAGVSERHADQTLGHSIRGIEKTYNRHSYTHEKAAALQRLAYLIEGIVRLGDLSKKETDELRRWIARWENRHAETTSKAA
jgi:integrase